MAGVLGVVVHVWEELLKEGWHASDATSDTVVKLQHVSEIWGKHHREPLSTACSDMQSGSRKSNSASGHKNGRGRCLTPKSMPPWHAMRHTTNTLLQVHILHEPWWPRRSGGEKLWEM